MGTAWGGQLLMQHFHLTYESKKDKFMEHSAGH